MRDISNEQLDAVRLLLSFYSFVNHLLLICCSSVTHLLLIVGSFVAQFVVAQMRPISPRNCEEDYGPYY